MCRGSHDRLRPPVRALAAGAPVLAAYAWFVTGFATFTWPARLAVLGTAVVLLEAAGRRRSSTRGATATGRATTGAAAAGEAAAGDAGGGRAGARSGGYVVWIALILALGAWELNALFRSPRSMYPTLSSLADVGLGHHAVRAAAFVVWLAAGWVLARR